MTGATIVRRVEGGEVVLAVHGAFDGASAWALRVEMEETPAGRFVIDLTHADEACDFAAGLLATWARQHWRETRLCFQPGSWDQARMLVAHGFELSDADAPAVVAPSGSAGSAQVTTGTLEPDAALV